jgi:GGDEF domain-containing protein
VAAIFIDLDHFNEVNDEYGHEAGDCVLREVARRIAELTRMRGDVVRRPDAGDPPALRLGGDEFVVLLPGTDAVSAAIGVALATEPEDPHDLLRRADAAMYEDKRRRPRPPTEID